MLNIRNNEKNLDSTKSGKRIIQVERDEVFYRGDIKAGFTYAMFALMVILAVGGIGYSFIDKLKK